eukprot:5602554-Amphidinium_carterae.1
MHKRPGKAEAIVHPRGGDCCTEGFGQSTLPPAKGWVDRAAARPAPAVNTAEAKGGPETCTPAGRHAASGGIPNYTCTTW